MSGLLDQPVTLVMKKDFVTAKKEDSLGKIVGLMAKKGVSFIPVVDESEAVIGTIAQRDLAKVFNVPTVGAIIKLSEEVVDECLNKPVKDIMTAQPITLEETHHISEAIRIFANNHIAFIPVVNKENVLVGILSLLDIVSHEKHKSS